MLAITASAGEVEPLLPEGVIIANINSPQQVVAAGPGPLIEEASTRLAAHGYNVHLLPVATAFHSPMVKAATAPFTDFLSGIRFEAPRVPVYANSTAQEYPADAEGMRTLLATQLARPVRFAEQIQAMYQAGARIFIEVGPGGVLSSLTDACLQGQPHVAVALDRKGKDAVTALWLGLAKLAVAGVSFDTEFAWRDYEPAAEPAARTPHAVSLSGTNFGKKYPRPEEPVVPRIRPTPAPVEQYNGDARLDAIRKIQEQMAESHAATQRALSESHLAYLRATEAAFSHLGGGAPVAAPPMTAAPVQVEFKPEPGPVAIAAPAEAAAPKVAAKRDLTELVMGIVAEKTGYPREILEPGMDLEADLGIDSIKRVQILAAVCEARPDLPQADAKNMATLRTLGAILDFLRDAAPAAELAPRPVASPSPASIAELVLSVVAEKTGYPREILTREMDLEADLGIDSIKRVQILAAVRETRSDLPDVDPKQMGALRTLGAIIAYLSDAQPEPVGPPGLPAWLSKNGLQRVALREVAATLGRPSQKLPARSRITVAGEAGPLRDSVAESLKCRGIHVCTNGAESDGTVFLAFPPGTVEDMLHEAQRAFDAARRTSTKGLFVTVTQTGSPLRRGLAALSKTVALENPGMIAKAICVDSDEVGHDLGERIVEEILHGTLEPEIILQSDGGRVSVEEFLKPVGAQIDTSLLQGRPVIVVTGGARGVTASCVRGLAEVAPLRLALLGRSSLEDEPAGLANAKDGPALKAAIVAAARARGESILPKDVAASARRVLAVREIGQTLDKLRELGSEVEYFPCDVTDAGAIGRTLDAVRARWHSIDGLIHGAGVVEDKRIADKSREQFERVFGTKVLGLRNLLDAIHDDQVRFILLFSSVAGRYGNAGQVDYAMANATMCQMALDEAARRGNCLVRALGWGPWDGGMVTPDLRLHFENRGIPTIPMERGVAAFVQEVCHLSNDPADIDVVLRAHSSAMPGDAH